MGKKLQRNNRLCHSHGTLLHIRSSYVEGNTDIKLIRHRFALDQPKLADMVAVVRGVNEVGVVQFPCLHQHVVHLERRIKFIEHSHCVKSYTSCLIAQVSCARFKEKGIEQFAKCVSEYIIQSQSEQAQISQDLRLSDEMCVCCVCV